MVVRVHIRGAHWGRKLVLMWMMLARCRHAAHLLMMGHIHSLVLKRSLLRELAYDLVMIRDNIVVAIRSWLHALTHLSARRIYHHILSRRSIFIMVHHNCCGSTAMGTPHLFHGGVEAGRVSGILSGRWNCRKGTDALVHAVMLHHLLMRGRRCQGLLWWGCCYHCHSSTWATINTTAFYYSVISFLLLNYEFLSWWGTGRYCWIHLIMWDRAAGWSSTLWDQSTVVFL